MTDNVTSLGRGSHIQHKLLSTASFVICGENDASMTANLSCFDDACGLSQLETRRAGQSTLQAQTCADLSIVHMKQPTSLDHTQHVNSPDRFFTTKSSQIVSASTVHGNKMCIIQSRTLKITYSWITIGSERCSIPPSKAKLHPKKTLFTETI